MAASELNNRLDYLISYSSQLVFVCSDKIQQQSQVIESFLAHQNEQADLALLTANELTPLVTYREKLFRQLISQSQTADFNRPLNQLLSPLNNHSGPILINIFQAEKLPNKLVKELWDLVLQSRFANNKQHLNVLLMGLSDWAESAKSGLGAKSKGQPIVLNSQTDIQYVETPEFSDLESFIQDKRKKFAQRLEDRHEQPYISQAIYKKWWVATLFGLVFIATFAAMLSWQYPENMRTVISFIDAQLSTQEQTNEPSEVIQVTPRLLTESSLLVTQSITELAAPQNTSIVNEASTKDILVTNWSTASAKLDEQSNKVLLQTSNIDKQINTLTKLYSESEQPALAKHLEAQTGTVNDYQIEDKVEVEPIPEQRELQLGRAAQFLTGNYLAHEHDLLLALPNKNFVIQIAAMANISVLQNYIREEQLGQQLWLYKTQRYGADWYVLLKRQHFSSIEGARAEIINLEDAMLRNTPFVKSIGKIKQEIRASKP